MKIYIFLILGILGNTSLISQQLPLQSDFNNLQTIINPGSLNMNYLYSEYRLNIGVSHRNQWSGIKNAPKTNLVHADYFHDGNAVGIISGGYIIQDKVSKIKTTGVYGKIGGLLSDDPYYHGISLGISAGLVSYSIDTRDAQLIDKDDVLAYSLNNTLSPDMGLGVAFYSRIGQKDMIFGGLSVPQLLGLDLSFKNDQNKFDVKRIQHYYAQLGYKKGLSNDESYFELSSWLKYVKGAPLNVDFNLKYQINEIIYLVSGFNSSGFVLGGFGIYLNDKIGYNNLIAMRYGVSAPFFGDSPRYGISHELGFSIGLFK